MYFLAPKWGVDLYTGLTYTQANTVASYIIRSTELSHVAFIHVHVRVACYFRYVWVACALLCNLVTNLTLNLLGGYLVLLSCWL